MIMGNFSNGRSVGRKNKSWTDNRPKSDGFFGTSFGQTSSNAKKQSSFDKGHSLGRKERRSQQSCIKNFFE